MEWEVLEEEVEVVKVIMGEMEQILLEEEIPMNNNSKDQIFKLFKDRVFPLVENL